MDGRMRYMADDVRPERLKQAVADWVEDHSGIEMSTQYDGARYFDTGWDVVKSQEYRQAILAGKEVLDGISIV